MPKILFSRTDLETLLHQGGENVLCVVANMLDCIIVVSEFELKKHYCVYFWTNTIGKGMNSLIPLDELGLGLGLVSLMLFYKDIFNMK